MVNVWGRPSTTRKAQSGRRWPFINIDRRPQRKAQSGWRRPVEKLSLWKSSVWLTSTSGKVQGGRRRTSGCTFHHALNWIQLCSILFKYLLRTVIKASRPDQTKAFKRTSIAREGVIIEWPLLWQFHDPRDVILTSWTVVIRFLSNGGRYIITVTKRRVIGKILLTAWSRLRHDR